MSISSLQSELRYWQRRALELTNKLNQLKKRKKDVEDALKALDSTVRSNVDDVNSKIKSTVNDLDDGIRYEPNNCINSIFDNKYEGETGSDSDLSSAASELRKEISDTGDKITETEQELAAAVSKIKDLQAEIAAEAQRELAEKAKKTAENAVQSGAKLLSKITGKS